MQAYKPGEILSCKFCLAGSTSCNPTVIPRPCRFSQDQASGQAPPNIAKVTGIRPTRTANLNHTSEAVQQHLLAILPSIIAKASATYRTVQNDMSGRNCATYPAHSTLLVEGAHNHGESSAPSAAEGWEVGREIKPRSSKRSNAALSGAIVTKTSVLACALLRTRVCRKVVDQHHPNLHLMSHDEG